MTMHDKRSSRRIGGTLALACAAATLLMQPAMAQTAKPVAAKAANPPAAKAASPGATQQHFATPEAAVAALRDALKNGDTRALLRIAGSDHRALVTTGVPAEDAANYADATVRLNTLAKLDTVSEDERILLVGAEAWPFPIPIVREAKGWRFASELGEEEILNRRIGENELHVIDVMQAYTAAQRQFATADRDGDGVIEFAGKLKSTAGKHDGLYWPADPAKGEDVSPWGPLIAASAIDIETKTPDQPYRGYRYRVLTRQGPHATGGAFDYVINGHMVAGYGLVGFPAEPGVTGVMTFIVNQNGKVFERDLGADSVSIGKAMTTFDPGEGWKPVEQPPN
jgi:hypothetical protein